MTIFDSDRDKHARVSRSGGLQSAGLGSFGGWEVAANDELQFFNPFGEIPKRRAWQPVSSFCLRANWRRTSTDEGNGGF